MHLPGNAGDLFALSNKTSQEKSILQAEFLSRVNFHSK
jgi:hypothetical protein